jgi:hypothetical protein
MRVARVSAASINPMESDVMNAVYLRLVPTLSSLLALCMLIPLTSGVFAQSDPRVGTWALNLAKSTFNPGPPPKKQTLWYKAEGQGLTALLQGIDAAGKPINPDSGNLAIYFDGKDHPTPQAGYDSSVWTRVNVNEYVVHRKKAGKIVLTSTNVVSNNGLTMTIATKGIDADGRPINNVRVYDRQ